MATSSDGQPKPAPKLWSSIASMNTSKRNKTNTLEIRLESDEGNSFTLNTEEIERLLRRLNIKSSEFTSVQACPERRNVVFITLCNGIDISKFIRNGCESFLLKQGTRTTVIKEASKREVQVQIFGLHPDTRDDAVIRYLNAHGKVNPQAPVVYGVYSGVPGSSILAGKRNGTRIYSMEISRNMGSTHIIDGEKVSVKYPGQIKTCNKCQKPATVCPGKGIARECTLDKVLLSEHMYSYWQEINFTPDNSDMNQVDEDGDEIAQEQLPQVDQIQIKPSMDPKLVEKYGGVMIKGFKKDHNLDDIISSLKEAGLPRDYEKDDLQIVDKMYQRTIYIHDLRPKTCVNITNNLHGQVKLNKNIQVYPLVEDTPIKNLGAQLESLLDTKQKENSSASSLAEIKDDQIMKGKKLWANDIGTTDSSDNSDTESTSKRKAGASPELNEQSKSLTKREKKRLKKLQKSK